MRALIAFVILFAAAAGFAEEPLNLLLRQARYWQARGREDKAAEAFEKVLRSEPREPEALCALGAQSARLGDLGSARSYLARLKAAAPDSADAKLLERAIAIGPEFDRLLAQARSLSRDGKTEEAAVAYRKLFGDGGPPRHLSLEYYATLGGTRDGWSLARDGIAALVRQAPTEPVYRLAQGRLYSYREETRREGIGILAKLVGEGVFVEEADASLRKALLWLRLAAGDDAALSAYLVRHPDDAEVKKRLLEPRPDLQRAGAVAAGYDALEHSDLKNAERIFKTAKAADSSADTVVGQALVALRREEFGRARELLTRAKQLAPGRPDLWERSLRSATFWALMQDAAAARAAGRADEADGLYAQAEAASPDERPHAQVARADLATSRGQTEKAELRLRGILRERPDMPEALRALLAVLLRGDRIDEAQQVNERLRKLAAPLAFSPAELDAELLRFRAASDAARGRYDLAKQALAAARASDPKSRWVLHDLANLELKLGELPQAREAAQALAKLDPSMPEARVIFIRLLSDEGDDEAALSALSALPPEQSTAELRDLRPLLEVRAEAQRIVRRAPYDRRELVRDDLLRLQQRMRGKPEVTAAVARAWAALGEHARAVELMTDAVTQAGSAATPGLKLDLAAVLLKSGHESQLQPLLAELDADPRLAPRERRGLADLQVAVAVRHADKLREAGDLPAAFTQLASPLDELPDDPRLLCALGRVFLDADRAQDAQAVFLRILQGDPDNVEARQGAVQSSVQLRKLSEARSLVEGGIERLPREPRMHLLAARYHVQLGDDGDAMTQLREAQAVSSSQGGARPSNGRLTIDSPVADILSEGRRAFGAPQTDDRRVADALALQDEIQREIDAIQSRHSTYASGASELSARQGEAGMSELTVLRAPIEMGFQVGYRGRLLFTVAPLATDAGAVDFTKPEIARRFGSGETPLSTRPDLQLALHDAGTELKIGYQQGGLSLDLGSTPLGLPLRTAVGGVRFRYEFGGFGFAVEASRRPVEDSALSFGGIRDPLSGAVWGGVTANGGRLDLGYTTASATFYAWGGFAALLGTGVMRNQQGAFGSGAEWTVLESGTFTLGAGLALTALGDRYNLRYFTLGQGGYFSPQAFVNAGVPLRMHGAVGRLRWDASAQPGLNWFTERRSPYFPLSPDLQARRESETDANGDPLATYYAERSSTAFAFDASTQVGFQLSDALEGSLVFRLHHADDYDQVTGGLSLRYSFSGGRAASRPLSGKERPR
jgi:predicted Zn-dependent protease